MNSTSTPPKQGSIDITGIVNDTSKVHTNIAQNFVLITEDKLELCLLKHQGTLKAKSDWKTPVALIATLIPVLITADFKKTLGLSAETWTAIFVLSCLFTGIWSLKTIHQAYKLKNAGDIEKIISDIKKNSEEST